MAPGAPASTAAESWRQSKRATVDLSEPRVCPMQRLASFQCDHDLGFVVADGANWPMANQFELDRERERESCTPLSPCGATLHHGPMARPRRRLVDAHALPPSGQYSPRPLDELASRWDQQPLRGGLLLRPAQFYVDVHSARRLHRGLSARWRCAAPQTSGLSSSLQRALVAATIDTCMPSACLERVLSSFSSPSPRARFCLPLCVA